MDLRLIGGQKAWTYNNWVVYGKNNNMEGLMKTQILEINAAQKSVEVYLKARLCVSDIV